MKNKKGFTLLELLVVVLIIGILAGIALPQYKRAIEKSKMAEAVSTVRAIASAQQRYYLVHGKYAACQDLNALDINLGGEDCTYNYSCICKKSANFMYMANSYSGDFIAFAQRIPLYKYYIDANKQGKISCHYTGTSGYQPTKIQKELCDKLTETGSL